MKSLTRAISMMVSLILVVSSFPLSVLADELQSVETNENTDGAVLGYINVTYNDDMMSYSTDEPENIEEDVNSGISTQDFVYSSNYPSSYDLRDYSVTTPVKNQGNSSSCWAFSAIACVEQNLVKKGYENNSVDFSEADLAWFSQNTAIGSDEGVTLDSPFTSGGNWIFSTLALARWSGLEYDDYEPFLPYSLDSMNISGSQRNVSEYHLNKVISLQNDEHSIKDAVMNYGGVSVSYFDSDDGFSSDENSYYYSSANDGINHAVTIVGWNDNYSRTNFNSSDRPSGNGAWLVKGSWSNFSDDGYYWISYYEPELRYFCAYDMEDNSELDNIYTYNGGYNMVYAYTNADVYSANVFTSERNEYLKSASFMVMKSNGDDVGYKISVYKDTDGASPVNGELVATSSGTVSDDGYYTADLNTDVYLSKGTSFSIVLCLDYSGEYNYAVFEGSSNSNSNSGESYISADGDSWTDTSNDYNNAYINAYTVNADKADKSSLESLVNDCAEISGVEKELINARKVINDSDASFTDINNAYLLLKSAEENSSDVVTISSISDWNSFSYRVKYGSDMSGIIVLLENNLDFSSSSFLSIGMTGEYFNGCFDGNGHTLSGINYSATSTYSGVFYGVDTCGQVKNLVVKDSTISGKTVGGIVGDYSGYTLKNCGFNGKLTNTVSSGGLVGRYAGGNISNCYSNISSESTSNVKSVIGTFASTLSSSHISNVWSDCSHSDANVDLISLSDLSSLAYNMNTINSEQADSEYWTMEDNSAVFADNTDYSSHRVVLTLDSTDYVCYTDNKGTITLPSVSVEDGYTVNWYYNNSKVTTGTVFTIDCNVYGKKSNIGDYTISYVLNGGVENSENPEFINNGETVELFEPTREGCTFDGWYDNAEFNGDKLTSISNASANVTLYAKWIVSTYQVTFLDAENNVISQQTVEYGSPATEPTAPEIEDMIFSNWDCDISSVKENMTVSPVYVKHISIENVTVSGLKSKTYTGSQQTQNLLNVILNGSDLKLNTDYYISYMDNVLAGYATVTITGKGDYYGSKTCYFIINPKSITSLTYSSIATQYYTSNAITPNVTISDSSVTLRKTYDYTLVYSNNYSVGTGKITVTFKGNYTGTKSLSFTIAKCPSSKLTYTAIANHVFKNKEIKPALTIKNGSKQLVSGTDYTAIYSNNISTGKASVTVTFKGNYSGTKALNFIIVPKKVKLTDIVNRSGSSGAFRAYWNTTNSSGYVLQYSTSSTFSSHKNVWITSCRIRMKYVNNLTKCKTYYIRVMAYKTVDGKKYYGSASNVMSIKL